MNKATIPSLLPPAEEGQRPFRNFWRFPFLVRNNTLGRSAPREASDTYLRRHAPHQSDLPLYEPANVRGFFWINEADCGNDPTLEVAGDLFL